MWEINNYNQLISFLLSLCLGALFCVLYDIIRATRRVWRKSFFAVTVEDILMWVVCAFATFIFLIARTNGEIRGYVLIGELFGFILFRVIISKFLIYVLQFIFQKIAKVFDVIQTFFDKIYLFFAKLIFKIKKQLFEIWKTAKKLLKNTVNLCYTNKNIADSEKNSDETKTKA